MSRRLRSLVAALGAAVLLAVPTSASAASAAPADDSAAPTPITWYDPVTHPTPHQLLPAAPMQTMATGGGCTVTYGANSCISYHSSTRTLNADFYVQGFDHVSSAGTAYLYIVDSGNTHYMYTVATTYVGHYPETSLGVGGSGYAYTVVDFYGAGNDYIMSAYSPTQYYP